MRTDENKGQEMAVKEYDLVIFDWDGTLMDSLSKIVKCMQQAARDAELAVLEALDIHEIIGLELGLAIQQLYPSASAEQVAFVRQRYSHHYVESDRQPCLFYPGVELMLQQLAEGGKTLSVATGKSRKGLDRVLAASSMKTVFDSSRCADETESKPSPAMVNELLQLHGVPPERAVMIGDTEFDMEMAQRAGVDRIGVAWGAHPVARLQAFGPVGCVESVEALTGLLL